MVHSSRRPASAQKLNVVPCFDAGGIDELLRLLQVEGSPFIFLLYAELDALIRESPIEGVARPEKAARFIVRRSIA